MVMEPVQLNLLSDAQEADSLLLNPQSVIHGQLFSPKRGGKAPSTTHASAPISFLERRTIALFVLFAWATDNSWSVYAYQFDP